MVTLSSKFTNHVNTSGATAVAGQINKDKIAYVSGERVVGTYLDIDMLTSLHSVWEFDAASFGNGFEAEDEITGTGPAGGLVWGPNNGVNDIAGLLNGGANLGAADGTTATVAYRWLLKGTDAAYDTAAEKLTLFGAGTVPRSFSWAQWIYPTTDPLTAEGGLIGVADGATLGWKLSLHGSTHASNSSKVVFTITHSGGNTVLVSTSSWSMNAWNLVGCTYDVDTDEIKIFLGVGGASDASVTSTANGPPIDGATNNIHALATTSTLNPLGARWDQSALWSSRAINQDTFDAIYNSGTGLLHSGWY